MTPAERADALMVKWAAMRLRCGNPETCSACRGVMRADLIDLQAPDHDQECERELTSHGYTPCRCDLRATLRVPFRGDEDA